MSLETAGEAGGILTSLSVFLPDDEVFLIRHCSPQISLLWGFCPRRGPGATFCDLCCSLVSTSKGTQALSQGLSLCFVGMRVWF